MQVCIPLLRNLVRRASRQQRADSLAVTGYRGVVWRVILGVIGDNPERWETELAQQREAYNLHAKEVLKVCVCVCVCVCVFAFACV